MIFYRNSRRMLRQPRAGVKLEMEKIYRFSTHHAALEDGPPCWAVPMSGLFQQVEDNDGAGDGRLADAAPAAVTLRRRRRRTSAEDPQAVTDIDACPHCEGTGLMRTASSAGLSALRIVEDEAARGRGERITLRAGKEAAVYVLNKKRAELADIEQRYGVMIDVQIDESFEGARMSVDSSGPRPVAVPRVEVPTIEDEEEFEEEAVEAEDEEMEERGPRGARTAEAEGEPQARRRRRRRRGGRGRNRRDGGEPFESGEAVAREADAEPESAEPGSVEQPSDEQREGGKRRRRRRGRGGGLAEPAEVAIEPESSPMVERPFEDEPPIAETQPAEESQPKRRRSRKPAATAVEAALPETAPVEAPPAEVAEEEQPAPKPRRGRAKKTAAVESEADAPALEPAPPPAANNDAADDDSDEPRRSGWWQRTFG